MITPYRLGATRQLRHASAVFFFASSKGGRIATYRRLSTQRWIRSSSHPSSKPTFLSKPLLIPQRPLNPLILPLSTQLRVALSRLLHTSPLRFQQPRPVEDIQDPPREEDSSCTSKADSQNHDSKDETKDEKSEDEASDSKKKDEPPPPPHGDKSPWQVFTETLRSEFKASKEWNESTKQLASSAHQFTESESVKKARAAYDATAGAATSKTADALKTTGKALGQGAAWTWDTKVVQGIRGGVNATGRGIEKATRPVRETQTFQSIKEAVDDGSSSRYGGWVEKEERRKKKELRELREVQAGRRAPEKMEEDPKYGLSPTRFCASLR
jgi:mitochondrial import inner membrane translocase subunit TIM44